MSIWFGGYWAFPEYLVSIHRVHMCVCCICDFFYFVALLYLVVRMLDVIYHFKQTIYGFFTG